MVVTARRGTHRCRKYVLDGLVLGRGTGAGIVGVVSVLSQASSVSLRRRTGSRSRLFQRIR